MAKPDAPKHNRHLRDYVDIQEIQKVQKILQKFQQFAVRAVADSHIQSAFQSQSLHRWFTFISHYILGGSHQWLTTDRWCLLII